MVLLLTDVFLLLTQVLLWIVIGLVTWFVLLKALPKAFLGMLVLLLILLILGVAFAQGPRIFDESDIFRTLWYIISLPFRPLSLGLILLLILLTGVKINKVVGNIIRIGLALLLACCLPIVSYFLAQELEWEGIRVIQPLPPQVAGTTQVTVLLGQGTTRAFLGPRTTCPPLRPTQAANPAQSETQRPPDGEEPMPAETYRTLTQAPTQLPIQLTDKADRLLYAAQLQRQNPGSLLVISAPRRLDRITKETNGETRDLVSEAKDIQTFLNQTLAVPCEAMRILDHDGVSLRKSAENIKKQLDDNRINYGNQLTVVNTGMSMERTFRTFREVFGFCPLARPTDFYTLPARSRLDTLVSERDLVEHNLQATDFLPSVDALYLGSQAIEEYASSLYYFLRGWIKFRDLRDCGSLATAPSGSTPAVSALPTPLPTRASNVSVLQPLSLPVQTFFAATTPFTPAPDSSGFPRQSIAPKAKQLSERG